MKLGGFVCAADKRFRLKRTAAATAPVDLQPREIRA
jgi:hypothetical protein